MMKLRIPLFFPFVYHSCGTGCSSQYCMRCLFSFISYFYNVLHISSNICARFNNKIYCYNFPFCFPLVSLSLCCSLFITVSASFGHLVHGEHKNLLEQHKIFSDVFFLFLSFFSSSCCFFLLLVVLLEMKKLFALQSIHVCSCVSSFVFPFGFRETGKKNKKNNNK